MSEPSTVILNAPVQFLSQKNCLKKLEATLGVGNVWLKQTSTNRDAAYIRAPRSGGNDGDTSILNPPKGTATSWHLIATGIGWADVYNGCLTVFAAFDKDNETGTLVDKIMASKMPQPSEPLSESEVRFNAHVDECEKCQTSKLCVDGDQLYLESTMQAAAKQDAASSAMLILSAAQGKSLGATVAEFENNS